MRRLNRTGNKSLKIRGVPRDVTWSPFSHVNTQAPIFFRLTENVPHFGYIPEYDMARFMEHRVIEATEYASHYRKKSDDKIARSITATRLGVPQVHGDAEDEEEEDLDVSGDEFCQHMIRRIEEVVG